MGKVCTIHGCIFGSNIKENIDVIESLPEDDEWPRLTRNMFSITSTDYDVPGFYKVQMIHFGASIKYLDEDWDELLEKFEYLNYSLVIFIREINSAFTKNDIHEYLSSYPRMKFKPRGYKLPGIK